MYGDERGNLWDKRRGASLPSERRETGGKGVKSERAGEQLSQEEEFLSLGGENYEAQVHASALLKNRKPHHFHRHS